MYDFKVKVTKSKIRCHMTCNITRKEYVKYGGPASSNKEAVAKVKHFEKWVIKGQGHYGKNCDIYRTFLSQCE